MKTLYESILSSTNSGKEYIDAITKKKIEEWMNKNNGACKYVINSDLTITLEETFSARTIYLYDTYDELPEYIKFKNCDKYNVAIYNATKIKSFRGLPEKCNEFNILSPALKELPSLKISCNNFYINAFSLQKIKNLEIDFVKIDSIATELKIDRIKMDTLENIYVKNVETIDIGPNALSEKFYAIFERKSKLNIKKANYEYPISDNGLQILNDFLGKNIDQTKLINFKYSQRYQLIKHNGEWYKFKK